MTDTLIARSVVVLAASLLCVTCAKSPVAPNGSVTIAMPQPLAPVNGALVPQIAQPITLTVSNAATTGGSEFVVYAFEVATDAGFANKVETKSAVQTPTQTSTTLSVLSAATYYWRARAVVGDAEGGFTGALSFSVIQPFTPTGNIQAPTPVAPALGSIVVGLRPTLTVNNATRSGVGAIAYWFEVATDAGFSNVVASGGAAEGTTRTSFAPASNLSFDTTYFWHARGFEISSGQSGSFSSTWTFTTGKAP